ncbi:MAG: hypothetical protein U9R08_03845 [Nanoarchaeota archaeon]|nr:hypothetical protein [Nanoarchaeota archaeon]
MNRLLMDKLMYDVHSRLEERLPKSGTIVDLTLGKVNTNLNMDVVNHIRNYVTNYGCSTKIHRERSIPNCS